MHAAFPILQKARELGFCAVGITSPSVPEEDIARLADWLSKGYHAQMEWMERNLSLRIHPDELVAGTKSAVVVALPYYTLHSPFMQRFRIARYARGLDYHGVIREKLRLLSTHINGLYGPVSGRAFSDSAPVMEHALAVKAGLGWLGKNGLLYVKGYGSYVLLGVLFVNVSLGEFGTPLPARCGSCTACMDACPSGAICAPLQIDARRCLSYLTIEHKGAFPADAPLLHRQLFGCDICQEVCPWNREVTPTRESAFEDMPRFMQFTDRMLWNLTETEFQILFKETPVVRTGYAGWRRNLEQIVREEGEEF